MIRFGSWLFAFVGTAVIYSTAFAVRSELLVHIAFALALALSIVTLKEKVWDT